MSFKKLTSMLSCIAVLAACARTPGREGEQTLALGPTDYIVPANYQGPVVVWFGRSNGVQGAERDGRTVFRVSPNGLLEVRAAEQPLSKPLDMRFRRDGSDTWTRPARDCRPDRRGAPSSSTAVEACWLPTYGASREGNEVPHYVAIAFADSAHVADAYNKAAEIITLRIFGEPDNSFRWVEPRKQP